MLWDRSGRYRDYCLVDKLAKIDKSAIIGPDSMSIKVDAEKGELVQFRHQGTVTICKGVEIGPLSVIHRASLGNKSTVIGNNTHIGTMVNIGHNSVIGNNCVIVSGTNIGGSVIIGDNVWIGMSVKIAPHVKICDHAVIGIGTVVINNITEPGIYIGNPARFLKKRSVGKPL